MGAAAAIAAGTFLYATQTTSGKRVSGTLAGEKPPPDLPLIEQPPNPADLVDPKRKKVAAATGRSDTILTGPKGLGEVGSENLQSKTLLGY
jgi:hypothetical protein